MIKSFACRDTEKLFNDIYIPGFEQISRKARMKLEILNAAINLDDLRIPPGNHLEKLQGKLSEYYSIRINRQWRIIFKWDDNNAHEVQIIDYH